MGHKTLEDGRKVIDWETGDPEGDRKWMMKNYREFMEELQAIEQSQWREHKISDLTKLFDRWSLNTNNQVDNFPRIWITRPE